jgi:hypothetical protein
LGFHCRQKAGKANPQTACQRLSQGYNSVFINNLSTEQFTEAEARRDVHSVAIDRPTW